MLLLEMSFFLCRPVNGPNRIGSESDSFNSESDIDKLDNSNPVLKKEGFVFANPDSDLNWISKFSNTDYQIRIQSGQLPGLL